MGKVTTLKKTKKKENEVFEYKITHIKTNILIPYINNSRTHSTEQVKQIAASIKEFGFTNPVLIDDKNMIIAGHGRLQAAEKLNMDKVPCIILHGLTDAQKKAYVIADNKLALNAGWDEAMLANEIANLQELDYNIDLLGFSADEINEIVQAHAEPITGLTDEDDCPDIPESPVTIEGDIWTLGNHRLMCGDSTMIDQVERLMNNNKADVLFTDPPYNIDFKPQRGTHDKILNDSMDSNKFKEFLNDVLTNAFSIQKKDTYSFIWCGWSTIRDFHNAIENIYEIKSLNIWVKNNFGIGYYTRPKYEPFFLCLNGNPKKPIKAPADVWEYDKVSKTLHSCEKPVGLIKNIFDIFDLGKIVYEPFGGSGSTLLTCEKTNRICYTMELDPKYIDVIIKRWEQYTGQKAQKIN